MRHGHLQLLWSGQVAAWKPQTATSNFQISCTSDSIQYTYFLPVMIKTCKFSCLLLIWQQTVIAAKRSTVRCGDDDHTDLELQIWEKFLQFLRDTWGNPSSEHAPPAALPLSLTSVGKISFTLLGLSTAPCPNLFSSRGTKASIQASPNPNPLSIDSQKSFALYCQGVSSSIQRSIQGWTRKPIRTGTSL